MKNPKPSDEIIDNVFDGLATTTDAKLVAEWLATDEGQLYLAHKMDLEFVQLKEGYAELYVGHDIPSEKMYNDILKFVRRKKIRRITLRVAAVLIPFVLVLGLFWQVNSKVDLFEQSEYAEVYVPKGERIQMLFQDGTKVYLNSDTRLRYPKKFGIFDRKIYLDGEGYFVVEKNAKRPFIVHLNDETIKVYGTEFNVKAYNANSIVKITLDEGKISFNPLSQKEYFISPGENLIYDRQTGTCNISKERDTKLVSLWKKDILVFKNTPLADVLKDLNRWYNVEFVVKDAEAYTYSYTITSDNATLETVIKDLEKISPVRFKHEGNALIVSVNKKDFKNIY